MESGDQTNFISGVKEEPSEPFNHKLLLPLVQKCAIWHKQLRTEHQNAQHAELHQPDGMMFGGARFFSSFLHENSTTSTPPNPSHNRARTLGHLCCVKMTLRRSESINPEPKIRVELKNARVPRLRRVKRGINQGVAVDAGHPDGPA